MSEIQLRRKFFMKEQMLQMGFGVTNGKDRFFEMFYLSEAAQERIIQKEFQNNNNRYYKMYQNSPKSFLVEIGRVGIQPITRPYPLSSWDTVYQKKLAEGYVDRSSLVKPVVAGEYKEIEDPEVRELIDYLQKESSTAIKENYTVSFEEITPQMLQEADKLLEQYGNNWQMNNKILCKLFSVIPRKMDQVKDYLLPENASEEQIFSVLQREQEFLDVLRTKIHMDRNQVEKETLLDSWKTSITPVTSERELGEIKGHMGENSSQFVRAFRVRNQTLDDAFWKNYKKNGYRKSDIHYYYHGTRNMNCLSIMKNGLLLNPNAPRTGAMFGHGIYLANKAQKSLHYTSLHGSLYAKGHSGRGYLFVLKSAYADPIHVSHWEHYMSCYTAKKIAPHDAVFAHAGDSLVNDEIIVFRESQVTLQYIIEVQN